MTPTSNPSFADQPAHWVLAELGKDVLRPGGRELTHALLDALGISHADDVVEFAPGTGFTAEHVLEQDPNSYTGIELDRDAASALAEKIEGPDREIRVGNAGSTDLAANVADAVYGEAMLTMHPEDGKAAIVNEASRLLREGGSYGIHELGLRPDHLDEATKSRIYEDLSQVLNVNARPLTRAEWVEALESAGFEPVWLDRAPMALLDPRRVIADEGLLSALRIGANLVTTPPAWDRIREMRAVFDRYDQHLDAIAIVAKAR